MQPHLAQGNMLLVVKAAEAPMIANECALHGARRAKAAKAARVARMAGIAAGDYLLGMVTKWRARGSWALTAPFG